MLSHRYKAMGGGSSQPWRDVTKDYQDNQDFVNSYKPRNSEVKRLRILLHGPIGAGKSSFINSVESALRDRISIPAQTDANSGSTFTRQLKANEKDYISCPSLEDRVHVLVSDIPAGSVSLLRVVKKMREYKAHEISKDNQSCYSFIFNDMMGLEEKTNKGVKVEDLKLALKGHVSDGYQFNPEVQLKANDKHYNSCPTLKDKVHVLVSVIPAVSVSLLSDGVVNKMREVRMKASEMGIPQLAILTKVDEAFPEVEQNMDNVYNNMNLKGLVDKYSVLLGLSPNCIFLVRNYHSEIHTNEHMNALILSSVKQMICFGEDFLNKK